MSETRRLSGKVAVITGASGGIGAGIALGLVHEGAKVVLGARRMGAMEAVKKSIEEETGTLNSVSMFLVDVTKREEMKKLVSHAENVFGPVDILVNNAGIMHFELLKNLNFEEWERTIDINCKGVLNGIGCVLSSMLDRKAGHIVNITSDAGRKVFPGLGVYSATKSFVECVSQALRLENVGSGLKVTCIQPGNVATDLVGSSNSVAGVDQEAMDLYGKPSECEILKPKDIAAAVVYAVTQPSYVSVNEVLVEPRDEPI